MLILNDSNANCAKNGIAVFMDPIETTEDILINSTCVFMADVRTSASIKATYDVTVYGSIAAIGNISIGGNLQCNKLDCADIHTNRNLTVTSELKCASLVVGGNATIGDVYCESAEIGKSLIVKHTIDSSGSVRAQRAIICFDSIVVDGCLQAPCVIVQNECDAKERQTNHTVVLSESDEQLAPPTNDTVGQAVSIVQAPIDDIYDFESVLATRLEDTASFIDGLQNQLKELPVDDLHRYIDAYADFLPGFSILKSYITCVEDTAKAFTDGSGSWYEAFCALAQLHFNLPEWLLGSTFASDVQLRLADLLRKFTQSNYRTKSRSQWSKTLNYISRLLNDTTLKPGVIISASDALPNLYSNVGLKAPAIRIFLPEN